ncbi:MAG TPA: 2-isopropylmalate synthase [Candidatus Eisenbacteria bacterium]|nr:2-isopropylmalate synthase [Candidatus Eisenbacteria bacterium]
MIKIFDTTLRDGEQSPGCSMNLHEKLQMAKQLERLGVDIIEAGFPAASQGDFESVEAIARTLKKTTICGLARCIKKDIDAAYNAIKDANYKRIHIFIATSDIHLKYKLNMTRKEVLASIKEHVSYAKSLVDDIEFSCEDASRTDLDFLCQAVDLAIKNGATTINLPDTVGYAVPEEYSHMIKTVIDKVPNADKVDISVHCHNDLGMAVANSLAAIDAGASQVECTINGIGERAGNAACEEIVMALKTRHDYYGKDTKINTKEIMRTSNLLEQITASRVSPTKAIVGKNVFAHEAGIHQHGVLQDKSTYEIMDPAMIGITETENLVLGKHSGKHALRSKLEELGYLVDDKQMEEVFVNFKSLSDSKKNIYDRDIHALMLGEFQKISGGYVLVDYSSFTSNGKESKTIIKLSNGDETVERVGSGAGPVDAAFDCMANIVGDEFQLEDFAIHSVTRGKDALGETFLSLRQDDQVFNGKGLSNDIIKSSIIAYVNAVNQHGLK